MKALIIGILFLIVAGLGWFSCSSYKQTSVPDIAGDVKAHWIKKGEPAPFDGILLSSETYGRLRTKIIFLEEQLHQCQENQ